MTIHETNEAAKAAGMTYGEYVLAHEAPVEPKPKEPEEELKDELLVETRICKTCGRTFTVDLSDGRKKKQIYCSKHCNNQAMKPRKQNTKPKDKSIPTVLTQDSQKPKRDAGKARLTLVPTRIIWDVAAVRQYGVEVKYPETGMDGWRDIGSDRIKDAAMRHFLRYLSDPAGKDEESGLPHLWHLATNIAFLCELEDDADGGNN